MAGLLALLLSLALPLVQAQHIGGINMTRFCLEPRHQHLLFCKHHLVPPAPRVPSCANVSIGQQVSVAFRGTGRVACFAAVHGSEVIAICQAPHTGHDHYSRCQAGQQTPPSFCGPRALWFVRCDQLLHQHTTTTSTPFFRPPHTAYTTAVPTRSPVFFRTPPHTGVTETAPPFFDHTGAVSCGCSWNSQHGCVVSANQMVTALTSPSLLRSACSSSISSLECGVRRTLASMAPRYRTCLQLSPSRCNSIGFCQWAAQGSGECGIDEDKLILELVGEQYSQHPLVKLIMLKKECSKYSENACDAAQDCAWVPSHPQSMCDVSPTKLIGMMFSLPSLVPALQRSVEEARCRTSHEAGSSCPSPMCVMLHGVCQHNPDGGALHSVDHMLTALCESSWQTARVCPKPCASMGGRCEPPRGSIEGPPLARDSEHVVRVMALLMSSVWPFEQRCFQGNSGLPEMCKASRPSCPQDFLPTPEDVLPHHETAMGPGLKGVLKQLSSAIGADEAGQFLQDHFENDPDSLKELTKTAYDSLSSFFKPASTTPEPLTTSEVLVTDASLASSVGPVETVEAAGPNPKQLSPWAIAGGAVLVAMCSMGMGIGMVCHARIARSQVREPLLAGGDGEVRAPARDREMEPVHAGPGSC